MSGKGFTVVFLCICCWFRMPITWLITTLTRVISSTCPFLSDWMQYESSHCSPSLNQSSTYSPKSLEMLYMKRPSCHLQKKRVGCLLLLFTFTIYYIHEMLWSCLKGLSTEKHEDMDVSWGAFPYYGVPWHFMKTRRLFQRVFPKPFLESSSKRILPTNTLHTYTLYKKQSTIWFWLEKLLIFAPIQ